jgi:hypothetical protein
MTNNNRDLFNINPKYSTTAAFILGLILIDDLNSAEQNALGEWLILIGQTLISNSGFQMIIENRIKGNNININSKELKSIYNPIIFDINKTKDLLKQLPSFNNDIDSIEKMINILKDKIDNIKKE